MNRRHLSHLTLLTVVLGIGLVLGGPQAAIARPAASSGSSAARVVSAAAPAISAASGGAGLAINPGGYPFSTAKLNQRDPWGFAIRQCTSYAAWFLNANGLNLTSYTNGPGGTARFGNASGWAASAQQAGWAISATPQIGAIAQWNAGETSQWVVGEPASGGTVAAFTAGPLGHVAVVTAIDPVTGLVTLSSYNVNESASYSVFQGAAPRYLLIGFPTARVSASASGPAPSATAASAVPRPVTRKVTGIVVVLDARGHRLRVRKLPVVASNGWSRAPVRTLLGGGFHTVLSAPGPWRLTTRSRGRSCTSATIAMSSPRPTRVKLVCRKQKSGSQRRP